MSESLLERLDAHYRSRFKQTKDIDAVYVRGRVVSAMLRTGTLAQPVDVVTMTRDPLTRNASAFFQTLPQHFPRLVDLLRASPRDPGVIEETIRTFERKAWMGDPFAWFNDELRAVAGFDAFAHEFDRESGYSVYRTPQLNLLVLRMEDLERSFARAINDFLGIRVVSLARANESGLDYYGPAYCQVRRSAVIPEPTLDRLYMSPLARHFYTDEELSGFRAAWERSGRAP